MRMSHWLAGALLAALLGGQAAAQPSQAQVGAIRQNCRGDYGSVCAGVPTGGQAALACLQQNMARLSPPCQQAVGAAGGGAASSAAPPPAARPPMQAGAGQMGGSQASEGMLREQCGMDYRTHCRGVMPGGGRVVGCLADNRESLSHGCREALMTMRERMR